MELSQSTTLILASTSKYRRALLERLAIPFSCADPKTAETAYENEAPEALARRLGDEKALAISTMYPNAIVIGSDQVAALSEKLIGKPGSVPAAEAQLRLCSGQAVHFFTAVSFARNGHVVAQRCVPTTVRFRELSAAEIADYVQREQPLDCAGSFRWEGLGICLFTSLESDDPTALEGLPLIATCDELRKLGINPLKTTI
ncbi:nucleoside triphosphate pyrophosphatase [Congregibacter brevis]|uniref:7-methyl-GTP pyrophosphatase n=1 Tax=Congregibacter brevis TaxID=3081201 RepID=A0ABZ0IAJ9_9GAMM|nr:nucleoside triphosphate pyrophosphatase [Congregibacter sp. IMCC45268]